jgi:hypothetical protein
MLSSSRLFAAGLFVLAACASAGAGGIDPRGAAKQIDELLAKEAYGGPADAAASPVGRADDETFLRRLALDLVGRPPSPEEVTAFALDNAADKREKAVDRLLARSEFGENWARYWRDAIMYRRSEDRALLVNQALVSFLAKSFNEDAHWDAIARKFITATGDVREVGETAIIMAQNGNTEDTTAEISRIFLGIQIQCAQCHNHPTDRWKREQFHELAAFFPRIAVRPVRDGEQRSFAVISVNRGEKAKDKAKPHRGALEHHMPDLNHPDQDGKLMKPVFFVTGQRLESGLPDQARREKLADWFTSRNNRWFARAFVNRMWSELVGHGFYEPVDDMGPDRAASAPHTLEYLADHFAGAQYDVKWLFRAITATEAYQRDSRSRASSEASPFVACATQRLRADQLFNTLMASLGVEEGAQPGRERNPRALLATPRGRMNATFGYDPSNRRDEVAGSIPQALLLMNAPELNRAIKANEPGSMLSQLLTQLPKDESLVDELYLRCLAREPSPRERETCLAHVQATGKRAEAFEDVLWSLVNSTEFLNRK